MSKKKLFIVTTVPETIATILRDQPRYLKKHYDVSIVTSPGNYLEVVRKNEEVQVYAVKMSRGISIFLDCFSIVKMVALFLRVRPQIVHSYTPKAGLVAMLSAWLCRVPVRIHTFTGLIFPHRRGVMRLLLLWIDRIICFSATTVVPEGEGVKSDLVTHHITRKPLEVIGHGNIAGVDLRFFDPELQSIKAAASSLKSDLFIEEGSFVFVFIGRLNADKGLRELCESFVQLPSNAVLLVVGGQDDQDSITDPVLHLMDQHPRIHRLGFLSDIRPALLVSDILVLPSYREGFPNVLLQAGAMCLPVIATDVSGSNEIVSPNVNGWLVPARQVNPLNDIMRSVMQLDSETLDYMGASARLIILERFDRSVHLLRMTRFYHDLGG